MNDESKEIEAILLKMNEELLSIQSICKAGKGAMDAVVLEMSHNEIEHLFSSMLKIIEPMQCNLWEATRRVRQSECKQIIKV